MTTTLDNPQTQGRRANRQATQPQQNATIRASAGTGKTFLLVSRLVRLLLAGAEPASLLAITFTRKAAAEMQQRLQQRLHEWLQAETPKLEQMLTELGVEPTAEQINNARHQFECLLRNDRQPRITTFHAFCQDILRRFPLEADVPPGFALLEDTGILAEQAWDGLWYDATQKPDSNTARALQSLLQDCGGIEACRRALFDFLHHRSDWWAFTDQAATGQTVRWASDRLRSQLQLDGVTDQGQEFFSCDLTAMLQEYHDLLARHDTATNRKLAAVLADIITNCQHGTDRPAIECLVTVFFTTAGEPRKVSESKARAKAIGENDQQRFLQLHALLLANLEQALERQRRHNTWKISTAWYLAGQHLLDHFQRLKQEQRLLDFTDLEWRACQLLNDGQHSHWIQYKLDRRISHILVDEFQDTNPTQWRLLLPLLEELAASGGQGDIREQRSVFLVGDEKQSIYRFRRADPRLFTAASLWLKQHTGAVEYPLAVSWRSSPAIIEVVNRIFTQEQFSRHLSGFPLHDTHRQQLSGRVELLPLIPRPTAAEDDGENSEIPFRNPLHSPRVLPVKEQHRDEGHQICRHIQALLKEQPGLRYSDILILIRQRTYLHDYEQAFREAGIPYSGSGRKTLLDTLEIQDIIALMQTLISPGNNHTLAQTLRSPLFNCSDNDLLLLASQCRGSEQNTSQDWYGSLMAITSTDDQASPSPALRRAARWLPHWRVLSHRLPVHDLLDRVFAEGHVEARFTAAFPEHLRRRVRANLTRLLELALEIDSGRYPSLPAFVHQIHRLHQYAPDNLTLTGIAGDEVDDAARIMTVHAAKGLEAAVVYLVDSGYKRPQPRAWQTLVDWPSDAARPNSFVLTGRNRTLDGWSRDRLEEEIIAETREDANLLYVALTRARQFLFISGCDHNGERQGWYQAIANAFAVTENDEAETLTRYITVTDDEPGTTASASPGNNAENISVPQGLGNRLGPSPAATSVRPSDTGEMGHESLPAETNQVTARHHGTIVHRLLELSTATPALTLDEAVERVRHEIRPDVTETELLLSVREVGNILVRPDLQEYFHPEPGVRAYNEVPLLYVDNGRQVHGVIDRLIITTQKITLIDYKSQSHADVSDSELSAPYRRQIFLYREGLRRLWPAKQIHALLIFTNSGRLVSIVD